MTPKKQLPAADVLTPPRLAQNPVRAPEISLTDSPCCVPGSPPSDMSCYKLSNHEKAFLQRRRVNLSLLKRLAENCHTF